MNVLQINSTVNYGSTGRIVEDLGNFIITQGGESIIAFGRTGNTSKSKLLKIGSKVDQAIHLVFTRLFDTHGFHSKRATINLIKEIQKINPDIIHLHNLHGYYLNIEILFSFLKKYKKAVLWTLHDCWSFTGHCCHYERVGCEKWKSQCYSCPLQYLYPESKWIDNSRKNFIKKKAIFNGVDNLTIITVSKWLQSQVKQSFIGSYATATIYNGIDATIFKPNNQFSLKKTYNFTNKKIVLGVANEWTEGKGFYKFIEISKFLDSNIIIILVGITEKQRSELPSNIVGVTRTKDVHQLVDYYAMADVFVTPSVAETFGMVVAEALSCGTPCIVNNSSALPELVDDTVGFVISNTTAEYVKAINLILSEPKINYREATLEKARQFDINLHLQSYYDLYKHKINS
jgi:glycosyltransferase involved in cell wall biosynthesis